MFHSDSEFYRGEEPLFNCVWFLSFLYKTVQNHACDMILSLSGYGDYFSDGLHYQVCMCECHRYAYIHSSHIHTCIVNGKTISAKEEAHTCSCHIHNNIHTYIHTCRANGKTTIARELEHVCFETGTCTPEGLFSR
jgi:hypothetical protein